MWRFDIAHLPGKTNCAADAASRHLVSCNLVATISHQEYDSPDVVEQALVAALQLAATDILCLQWHELAQRTKNDLVLNDLLHAVESGFNADCFNANRVGLRQYLPFRDGYYVLDGVILYKDRVVVPVSLRHSVLSALHAAHQGVSAMERRARSTVFWPGMTHDIYNVRYNCAYCNRNAPSQAATPPITPDPPSTPFEHIFADYFDYGGRHFLVIGDKFSGWTDVFGTTTGSRIAGAAALIRLFRTYFATFGVPEEISTDGGPEFTAFTTANFLRKWGVHHRVSSAYFPQSNGRAEVAVKTAKRLLMANVSPNGDLNSDSFLRAILQLRNTPNPDCGMSPAEIVFGRPLRDAFSFINRINKFSNRHIRRTWRETWQAKEDALHLRAKRTETTLKKHARPLAALQCGDHVFVQNQTGTSPGKWDKVGRVVEILPFDQYVIKVDGSGRITKRNRRFLRLIPTSTTDQLTLPGPEYAHPIPYRPDAASPVATFDNEKQACSTTEAGLEPSTTSPSEHTPLLSTLDSPSPKLQDTPKVSVPNTPTLMRRSTRTRRPALELDPASGQWVTKGFVSSLDRATNLGGMQDCTF